jgi:protein-S-isoprenylcysteine O-methyltransferase Ste14
MGASASTPQAHAVDVKTCAVVAVGFTWLAYAARWLTGYRQGQPVNERALNGGGVTWVSANFGFFLLLTRLGHRPRRADRWLVAPGVLMATSGLGLSLKSRSALARNWSADAALVQGQELVQSGPYARVRHPIYGAYLLMFLGTCLAVGTVETLALWLVHLWFLWRKASAEESLLSQRFGEGWPAYKAKSGSFWPSLRAAHRWAV